ncbi:MAG: spore coat protein U domain-containing protein [Hyphomonadaceae bacterium]|nr:spore coat protein U domain-containing protein [Hyphomonadaceae bacterium]
MSSAINIHAAAHAVPLPNMALVCLAVALLAPSAAHAGSDSASFTVSANVVATCEVVANDLDFGDYDPVVAAHDDAATTLSITCTNGAIYQIALNLGAGAGATAATRYMTRGGDLLAYGLYRNGARTQVWGESGGVDALSGTGTGAPVSIDLFGRIPMQQAVPAGAYQDTIIVTVTW